MPLQINVDKIPEEPKQYNQWIVWKSVPKKLGDKPSKVPYSPESGRVVSVNPTDKNFWTTFDKAVKSYNSGIYAGIGFVLTADDPFCCVDFDEIKSEYARELQAEFWEKLGHTFAEESPNGFAHFWLKAKLVNGRDRHNIGLYSSLRYMTFTGMPINDNPIAEDQAIADELWVRLGREASSKTEIVVPRKPVNGEIISDDEVLRRACNASNFGKFDICWNGRWQGYYTSASELNQALFNMLGFYSKDDEQVKRLFMSSPSAINDEKGKYRNDQVAKSHVDRMLKKCRDRSFTPTEIDLSSIRANVTNQITALNAAKAEKLETVIEEKIEHYEPLPTRDFVSPLFPQGLVGEIAQAIYDFAPVPVAEIALTGALAFMSGICGRCYNFNGAGLNMYYLLVASSGTGKEAMKEGIDMIYYEVGKGKTGIDCSNFRGPMKIASEQAIIKHFSDSKSKSLLSIYGEVAKEFEKIKNANKASTGFDFQDILLKFYSMSGHGKVLDESIYSDRKNNAGGIENVSFSFLGQSVPKRFFETLTEDMILNGLIPRFVVVEYSGPCGYLSEDMKRADPTLVARLQDFISNAIMLNELNDILHVKVEDEAKNYLREIMKYCTDYKNSTDNEVVKELWNRVHFNIQKLASIIAIGRNAYDPCINMSDVTWAYDFVNKSVRLLTSKVEEGDIGGKADNVSMGQNLHKIMRIVRRWYTEEFTAAEKKTKRYAELKKEGVIPMQYIQQRAAASMKDQHTFKGTVEALVSSGELVRLSHVDKEKIRAKYNWSRYDAEAFTISDDYKFEK